MNFTNNTSFISAT